MKRFAALFNAIDQSTKTTVKVAALSDYFSAAPDDDRLWTIALFSGRRPKRAVTTTKLREWAAERANIPLWLFEESYSIVGDLAETITLVLPPNPTQDDQSLAAWIAALREIYTQDEEARKAFVLDAWATLGGTERFIFNKLITGGFRVGVSQKLMTRALSRATGKPEPELAHRLMGNWHPDDTTWHGLVEAEDASADASRPYPFYLAYGLEAEPQELGDPQDWRAEWKWDGIRGQLILRDGAYFVWSRGEELMTDRFPELARAVDFMPDGTVLDGELLVWPGGQPAPSSFNALQARIGRKTVPKKLLAEAPVVLHAYDLLEWQGQDIRSRPFAERRALLEQACAALPDDA
ncbi:MAG TPA: ATP-dependent DNA ligase, partial [Sulfitobacter sp.]|nr:ATP-dependent DNA ligase [Sulfitobacter sp.]